MAVRSFFRNTDSASHATGDCHLRTISEHSLRPLGPPRAEKLTTEVTEERRRGHRGDSGSVFSVFSIAVLGGLCGSFLSFWSL